MKLRVRLYLWQTFHERVNVRLLRCLRHLFHGRCSGGVTVADVVCDGAGEQHRLLRNDAHATAE